MPHPLQVYNSSHEELFVNIKIYDVIEEKVVVAIRSRLRKRDKKSMEYYAGDYYCKRVF